MSLAKWLHLLEELLVFLPSSVDKEWSEPSNLQPDLPIAIVIAGFGATRRSLKVLRKRLNRDGFNVILVGLDWRSIEDIFLGYHRISEQLSRLIVKLKKTPAYAKTPIYIVAHSAGGLVARHYIQVLGGYHYCDLLITLGTPHRGTWSALFGLISHLILKARCLFQILPTSPFLKRINEAPLPKGFPVLSVVSKSDIICSVRATELPEDWKFKKNVEWAEMSGINHGEFLISKDVYLVVLQRLLREFKSKGKYIPFQENKNKEIQS